MISLVSSTGVPTHFLILSAGTSGDMYPFLAVGLALQRRGHRVTFFCPEIHRHLVEQAGIRCHPIGSEKEYLAILDNPDLWHPRKGIEVVLRNSGYGIDELMTFIANMVPTHEQVMLAHPLTLPTAAVIQHHFPSLRIVGLYLAPSNLRSLGNPLTFGPLKVPRWVPRFVRKALWNLIDRLIIDRAALPALNILRAKHGLLSAPHYIEHTASVPDLSVTLFPAWFGSTQADWSRPIYGAYFPLYDPISSLVFTEELATFLSEGPPPLIFTHGTGNRHAAHYFRCALAATKVLYQRAIFLTPYREQLPIELSKDVLWQPYISFSKLLPKVALLVHHGGIGTTAEALRAGLPQLVIPLGFDQFDNAARVESLGVGCSLTARRLHEKSLIKILESQLEPSNFLAQKSRCKEIAARFRNTDDDEDRLCDALGSVVQ